MQDVIRFQPLRNHPELVNEPYKFSYIVKNLLENQAFIDWEGGYYKVLVEDDPFSVMLIKVNSEAHFPHEETSESDDSIIFNRWDEVPKDVIESVVSKVDVFSRAGLLDYVDDVDSISYEISLNGDSGGYSIDSKDQFRCSFTTGDLPSLRKEACGFKVRDVNGFNVKMTFDSYDGFTLYQDGVPIIVNAWPDEILQWKRKAEKCKEIGNRVRSIQEDVYRLADDINEDEDFR